MVGRLRAAGCVFAEDESALLVAAAASPAQLEVMVSARIRGTPLEHVLGWAEFCGLRIAVDPGVFVPRRRSELLVRQSLTLLRAVAREREPVVVDLCCGSGAIGVALLASAGPLELHAVDIEPAAVRCARRNFGRAGRVYEGDLFAPLPRTLLGRVDLLAANVPYVPTTAISTMPPEAREYEPRSALDGGPDGLGHARRVVTAAPRWLAPGGHLLLETAAEQSTHLRDDVTRAGLTAQVVSSVEFDATLVVGTRH